MESHTRVWNSIRERGGVIARNWKNEYMQYEYQYSGLEDHWIHCWYRINPVMNIGTPGGGESHNFAKYHKWVSNIF